jgi:hypothetical protein
LLIKTAPGLVNIETSLDFFAMPMMRVLVAARAHRRRCRAPSEVRQLSCLEYHRATWLA